MQTQEICSEVQATALRPRLHHYEGFHYPLKGFPQIDFTTRNYNLVYTRLEYTTPLTQPSSQEVAQSQLRLQSSWWSNKNTNTLSYNFLYSRIWSEAQGVKWEKNRLERI